MGLKAYPEVKDKVRDRFLAEYFMNALIDGDQRGYVTGKKPEKHEKSS